MISENDVRLDRTLADERPASEHLAALGQTAEWERRADWLETEAKAQREPAARARLLLAASEVRALLGARAEARRLALAAQGHQPAPPFASRQARALHQTHGDVSAVARSLGDEIRSASRPELVAFAHYLNAEIQRLFQRDAAGARASLDAAARAAPSDRRVPLQQLVLELAQRQAPPEPLAEDDETHALARAVAVLRRLRGAKPEGGAPDAERYAGICIVDLQRALGHGNLEQAASTIASLEGHAGFAAAARWLRALWQAGRAERREDVLAAYRQLAREAPGRDSRRALAARALGAGSWEVLREAIEEPDAPEAASTVDALTEEPARSSRPSFSGVERAALAALVGHRTEPSAGLEPGEAPLVGSITSAVERASSRPPSATFGDAPSISGSAEAELTLGRQVAAAASLSDFRVDPAGATHWELVLRLEQGRRQRDLGSLARDLPRLLEQPGALAEGAFIAAVFAERAGDLDAARDAYQASLPSPTTREAATRALSERSADGAAAYRALSAHTTDPHRRALLLTEALFRLDPAAPEFDALAEDAVRTSPELPLALVLGELGARERRDRSRVARWLARRRELALGTDDEVLALAREASFAATFDPASASESWRELARREQGSLATALACERATELPAAERAELRRRLAPTLSPRGRLRLLAEAAALYEAAGQADLGLLAARELGGVFGALWQARLSISDDALAALEHDWSRAAQRAGDSELAADLYGRLARLEQRRGRHAEAIAWQRQRLAVEPGSLAALRAIEIENMDVGKEAELEHSASALLDALGEDGLGYAFVGARLTIARGAFDEARPFVRRAHAARVPPLWALRLDASYARDAGDEATLIATNRSLRERANHALDSATLSLHAAEAALRLGENVLAKDDIQRASELVPDDIVILSARAEVLRENRDAAEAAEAYETLASATSSKRRQVDALYQAAILWLDQLGNRARGMLALQEAASLDVPHAALLERLVALHAESDDMEGLGELIERQRNSGAEPSAADEIELNRALDWVEQGRWADARAALDALLERRPHDVFVSCASADLYQRERHLDLAERALESALAHPSSDELRLLPLRALATLYEGALPRPERLESVYEQIIALQPDDASVRRRLVVVLAEHGELARAIGQQRELVARAADEAERRDRLLELVQLSSRYPHASPDAPALLEQARRTWPDDPLVLEAEHAHYVATGDADGARIVAERAAFEARASIDAGRVDAAPFMTLEVASRLSGSLEAARVAGAFAAALAGRHSDPLPGAGVGAADPSLDDLLAPPVLDGDFRQLLGAAGDAIERAYALEPAGLHTTLPAEKAARVRELGLAFGFERVRVLVSPDVGIECRSIGSESLNLVLGQALVEHGDPRLLDFAVTSALHLGRVNGAVLSRLPAAERRPLLAGFLACFAPPWPASGDDAQRLMAAKNKLRPHITLVPESHAVARIAALTPGVLEAADAIAEALRCWAARVALLAVGDPALALEALWAASHASSPLPRNEEARIRWVAGNLQARDLVSFGASEPYMVARVRAGLSAASP
jgi:Tfp pilus assembly protein PilF